MGTPSAPVSNDNLYPSPPLPDVPVYANPLTIQQND